MNELLIYIIGFLTGCLFGLGVGYVLRGIIEK